MNSLKEFIFNKTDGLVGDKFDGKELEDYLRYKNLTKSAIIGSCGLLLGVFGCKYLEDVDLMLMIGICAVVLGGMTYMIICRQREKHYPYATVETICKSYETRKEYNEALREDKRNRRKAKKDKTVQED